MSEEHDPFEEGPDVGPPPTDRTWRHPSEVGAARFGSSPPSPALAVSSPGVRRPSRLRGPVSLVLGLGFACAAVAMMLVLDRAPDETSRRVTSADLSLVGVIASTSAPAAGGWIGVDGKPVAVSGTTMVKLTSVVADGPAAEAGLAKGDVVASIDGEPVTSMSDVRSTLATMYPGGTVEVRIRRDDHTRVVNVTLTARPSA